MPNLSEVIEELRRRAARLLARSAQPNEEETKSALVTPMLRALGWDCEDPDEVHWEYRYTSRDNPVDYALFVGGRPRLFVEAKPLGRDLGDYRWRVQAVNYANAAGVEWCVLTDGNFWQIYKSNASGDLDGKLFLTTCLHPADGRAPACEPGFALGLLSREELPEDKIKTLWTRLNVDRRGEKALQEAIREKDAALVRLLQKRAALTKREALAFLDHARLAVSSGAPDLEALGRPVAQSDRDAGPRVEPAASGVPSASAAARKAWETRRARGSAAPPAVPGLPSQRELELPLLRAILKRGGKVETRLQGTEIGEELAEAFSLSESQRTTPMPGRRETVWGNRIRWTRMRLVKRGDLDGSQRGLWAITEQGRLRAEQSEELQ
jgi:predicted type IV restriction endonuclease